MSEEFRVLRPYEYHSQLVSKGSRSDGRKLNERRTLKLETNAIKTADSSSLVKLGNTSLVCGCKRQLDSIKNRSDDSEEIKIKLELPPICSGPTGYSAQLTAQLLTRQIRNIIKDSRCINIDRLIKHDTDQSWFVDVEVICLNYDGSLLDAALIAILAALSTLKLEEKFDTSLSELVNPDLLPLSTSFAIIGGHIICDPSMEEENVAQSTFSITFDSTTGRCCNINKIGGAAISSDDLFKCLHTARIKAQEVIQALKTSLNPDLGTCFQ